MIQRFLFRFASQEGRFLVAQKKTQPFSTSSKSATASRRLYRILQRQCMDLMEELPSQEEGGAGETMFLIQPMLNPAQHGSYRFLPVKSVDPNFSVRNLLIFFRDWTEDNGEDDAHEWYNSIQMDEVSQQDGDTSLEAYLDFTDEPTLWATASSIRTAIRYAFRNAQNKDDDPGHRIRMTKFAIRAVTMLMEQAEMRRLRSISFEKNVRVVATSRHIGNTVTGPLMRGSKNRFNYRIRIENLSDQDCVQLLGRFWHIEDLGLPHKQGTEDENPIIVDAPNTGAVGQLPVLRPGEAFEYMSGCELTTSHGVMKGSFHMAWVPMNTPSATLQNSVAAFDSPDRFRVQVKPFPLEALEPPSGNKS